MDATSLNQVRKQRYLAIRGIQKSLSLPPRQLVHHLTPDVLQNLPISFSDLPFYADDVIDFEPRFCQPFPKPVFEQVFDDFFPDGQLPLWPASPGYDYLHDWHEGWAYDYAASLRQYLCKSLGGDDDPNKLISPSKWRFTYLNFTRGGRSGFSETSRNISWETMEMLEVVDTAFPHLATMLIENVPLDHRILRSEILCATHLIIKRLKSPRWKTHLVHPVFIYTFSGHRARVTQAHYDGKVLHLRRTEPVDFEHGDIAPAKMMMRWMMNEPFANTGWPGHVREDPTEQEPMTPRTPTSKLIRVKN